MKWVGFVALLTVATSAQAAKEPQPPEPATPPNWAAVRQQVEARVIASLVDPDSAKISWPNGFKWGGYKPFLSKRVFGYVTCGFVNSKNRMGGYVGDSPFVVVYDQGFIRYFEIESATERYGLLATQCAQATLPPPPPEFAGVGTSASAPAAESIADELAKLAALKDKGVITQAEFDAQKAKLLSR
ncbi:hypothetical protein GGR39_003446 [Novosphingobium fluoreni]|uniref:SHOCT domain-containing protein n=1 Tax=Novosphingobium fluoreni TaxID=1391222 RepID=A0A7W6C423_9SPHN|nr:SHOCT domain-containing protein [Novosphingobium fluoreni]MBB3941765.1 hypothetical protein [Novosphingobium fluoreni]